jgi:hypothetical protein
VDGGVRRDRWSGALLAAVAATTRGDRRCRNDRGGSNGGSGEVESVRLLVGCPVSQRAWILPAWFDHVAQSCEAAGVREYGTVFVVADADPSVAVIRDAEAVGIQVSVVLSDEPPREDERCWSRPGRYAHMALLRNKLLAAVRSASPDLFLSLDSDVLLHEEAVSEMLYVLDRYEFGAVASKTFMTPKGTAAPNFGALSGYGGLLRRDSTAVMPVDVIMAIKLMTPAGYAVDYVPDGHPEDIGWSSAARRAGVKLGWSGRVCSKHVMNPSMLDMIDPRCGF